MNDFKIYFIIFIATIIFYLPLIANPDLFLSRGNDLQEFFWPIIQFTKESILSQKQLPLWYSTILSGTPLLPDPQSMIFYIPNIVFLIFPMKISFIISIIAHTAVGGIGFYVLLNKGLKFTAPASLFPSILYITTPRLAAIFEAGHFGLITSWAWIPFVIFFVIKMAKPGNVKHAFLFSVVSSLIFFSHTILFLITMLSSILVMVYFKRPAVLFALAIVFTLGLISISLLPQLEWSSQTTRNLLLTNPDTYPKWLNKSEFVKAVVFPYPLLHKLDTEKIISLGLLTPSLAFLGFIKLKRQVKIILILSLVSILLVSLNNISPLYSILLKIPFFSLTRVATRIWVIIIFISIVLAGYALDKANQKTKKILHLVAILAVLESIFISWSYLSIPKNQNAYAPNSLINYIKEDPDQFRVFCLTRCISQRQAVENKLELIDGYSTLTQINYYKVAWGLTGTYWDYYSLSTPPFGAIKFGGLTPDYKLLGEYNTKYIISPYALNNENLAFISNFENFNLYKNNFYNNTNAINIIFRSPNKIILDTHNQSQISLSEVYNSGWRAYSESGDELSILESPIAQRVINPAGADSVTLVYQPQTFRLGVLVSLSTLSILIILCFKNNQKHTYH